MRFGLTVGVLALLLTPAGCADESPADGGVPTTGIPFPTSGLTVTATAADSVGDTMGVFDVGGGSGNAGDEGGDCMPTPTNATLRGTVYAPNLEIPISGAVVYVTPGDAEAVPDGVYCAECVEIPCNSDFVLTEPDGTFELPARTGVGQNLVVQKGQFLHVTPIDVLEGDNVIPPSDSNLPGEWNPDAGQWIPRIAVVRSPTYDRIYDLLGKIGLGQVGGNGTLNEGTENFDIYEQAAGGALLDDIEAMRQYHIIFIPCMSQTGMGGLSQQRIDNIRQWVSEGGKWYVTDWANEYLYETFPNYQTLHGQDFNPDLGYYDTTGIIQDPDLLAWLQALPPALQDLGGGQPNLLSLPTVEIVDNWSGIDSTPEIIVQDDEGNDVNVGHHEWVEGTCPVCTPSNELRSMTISGEYGCGRMMFSTYHTTEDAHDGLYPQELILLYIILEIGVCHDSPPPPPPPVG